MKGPSTRSLWRRGCKTPDPSLLPVPLLVRYCRSPEKVEVRGLPVVPRTRRYELGGSFPEALSSRRRNPGSSSLSHSRSCPSQTLLLPVSELPGSLGVGESSDAKLRCPSGASPVSVGSGLTPRHGRHEWLDPPVFSGRDWTGVGIEPPTDVGSRQGNGCPITHQTPSPGRPRGRVHRPPSPHERLLLLLRPRPSGLGTPRGRPCTGKTRTVGVWVTLGGNRSWRRTSFGGLVREEGKPKGGL